jgi:hypothetical protein
MTQGFLTKALEISGTTGARGNTYGSAHENFTRIAALWNAQLSSKLAVPLTPLDVAQLMILVKMSRLANAENHEDSWVDIAGYVNCADSILSVDEVAIVQAPSYTGYV